MKSVLFSFSNFPLLKNMKACLELNGWNCDVAFSEADTHAKLCLFNYDFHLVEYDQLLDHLINLNDKIEIELTKVKTVVIADQIGALAREELYRRGAVLILEGNISDETLLMELSSLEEITSKAVYSCFDLTLDYMKRVVRRGNQVIPLRNKEFSLLSYFMKNIGLVLTREQIVREVWDREATIFTNTVDVHIHKLRKKIDNDAKRRLIRTIPCIGYQFGHAKI